MHTELIRSKQFFQLARERYNILLRRRAGQLWPWTTDTHLQTWRFTNIFREDDRTTTWFRVNLRDPLNDLISFNDEHQARLKLVEATMIFRWFNRISTGEIIKDLLLDKWDGDIAYNRLKNQDKIFTGAYIVIGQPNMPKLNGVLRAIHQARPQLPRMVPKWGPSLEASWNDIKTIDYLGGFMSHEIVQDLRYTKILENATDINTWSNMGPGAIRGMSWIVYGHAEGFNNSVVQQKKMLELAVELLEMSRQEEYWPQAWPRWEMHQVEFLLCEVAKYYRSLNGYRQKRRYER